MLLAALSTAALAANAQSDDAKLAKLLHKSPAEIQAVRTAIETMSPYERARLEKELSTLAQVKSENEALKRFQALNSGIPHLMQEALPDSGYVEVTGNRLVHAKVIWVNRSLLLTKYGIVVSADGVTPQQEKAILDVVGYRVPHHSDPAGSYDFTAPARKFYTPKYGGHGLNGNFGGGRAMSTGSSDLKGGGQTPNVNPGAKDYYTKGAGTAYLQEGR